MASLPRRSAGKAVQLQLNLLLLHNHLALFACSPRQLSHKTVLEALLNEGRFVLMDVELWTRKPQAASTTADLLLEDVIKKGIRVVKYLVATRASIAGILSLAASIWFDM